MKYLFVIIFSSSIFASPAIDSDGWVAVAKPSLSEMGSPAQEESDGIWVVFSAQSGPEKMLIRFPEDPSYVYKEDGEMEIFTPSKGDECRLQILKKTFQNPEELLATRQSSLGDAVIVRSEGRMDESGPVIELTYWKEGWWHQERWISTPYHTYFFHTKTASMDLALHHAFTSSFDLETERH